MPFRCIFAEMCRSDERAAEVIGVLHVLNSDGQVAVSGVMWWCECLVVLSGHAVQAVVLWCVQPRL